MPATTFTFTGSVQYFTVPSYCTQIFVDLVGGSSPSARGGRVAGYLTVTPGEQLAIYCGGQGSKGAFVDSSQTMPAGPGTAPGTGGAASFNGGGIGGNAYPTAKGVKGRGGESGGGATDIRRGGTALTNRILCAGGAGGGAGEQVGGNGYNPYFNPGGLGGGNNDAPAVGNGYGPFGGSVGLQSRPGVLGSAGGTGGTNGSVGNGGFGDGNTHTVTPCYGAGGGGGGWYGGGGGGHDNSNPYQKASGGGGGANFADYGTGWTGTINDTGYADYFGPGYVTFTYEAPPLAPTLVSPVGNTYVDSSAGVTVAWQFVDPDVGDSQSAANLRIRQLPDGGWLQASTGGQQSYGFTGSQIAQGQSFEWQVQTADSSGLYGPWSASSFFNTAPTPSTAPTITYVYGEGGFYPPTPPVSATARSNQVVATTPTGAEQAQVRVISGATQLYKPDPVPAGGQTLVFDGVPITSANGTQIQVQARYKEHANSDLWSPWGDSGILVVNIQPPPQPILKVDHESLLASLTVHVTNPPGGFPAVSNDLYRTDTRTGIEIKLAAGLPPNGVFVDYTVPLNVPVTYRCVAFSAAGGDSSSA